MNFEVFFKRKTWWIELMVLWTGYWEVVYGPWWTMDRGSGRGSPGISPHSATWLKTSLRRREKVEWVTTVLTVGFGGRFDGGVRPVVKWSKRQHWSLVLGD
jgi:hypothetical protein